MQMNSVQFGARKPAAQKALTKGEISKIHGEIINAIPDGYFPTIQTTPSKPGEAIVSVGDDKVKEVFDLLSKGNQVDSTTTPATILYGHKGKTYKVQIMSEMEAAAQFFSSLGK